MAADAWLMAGIWRQADRQKREVDGLEPTCEGGVSRKLRTYAACDSSCTVVESSAKAALKFVYYSICTSG